MKISVCINVDTRDGFEEESSTAEHMFEGCRSRDFLIDGVLNKIKFFEGFDTEIILHIDEHNPVPLEIIEKLKEIVDTLVIRKHTNEPSFNDWTYIRTLQLATGDIVCHFDQDCAAFTSSPEHINHLIGLLEQHKYISYPSPWSPNATHDPSFNYMWVSTRFFLCKRETLNFPELIKCLSDYEYFCETYKPSRVCPWTEHFLSLISGNSVYYPPVEGDKYIVFCWGRYNTGTLRMLNNISYDDVCGYVNSKGGIHYPCDVED
jgi:hypothetical protein